MALVSFMDCGLGSFDKEVDRIEPVGENPFASKVLPMCPEWTPGVFGGADGDRTRDLLTASPCRSIFRKS